MEKIEQKELKKPRKKYENQKREVPQSVNDKFLIEGHKVSIYVKNQEEIDALIDYLDFDFIMYESQKLPFPAYIQGTEFVVSCEFNRSVVTSYKGDAILASAFQNDTWFAGLIEEALPLKVFFNYTEYPEYFI